MLVKSLTYVNQILYEFKSLALSANLDKKIGTELSDIMEVIEEIKKMTQLNLVMLDNIKEKGKKINYMAYIKSTENEDCNNAIKNVYNKINIDEISSIRKEFYKKITGYRYEILKSSYNKLNKI